ncbi:hypothetical protein B0A49_09241, partial [Cryomyces minteri]
LDDVIAVTSPDFARIEEAMHRSVRWLDRCIAAHQYPERQNLFCIVQGGLDLDLQKKPRYVMGVGYSEDLVVSVALGADMFDCVWPTRTARFGNAVTSTGTLNLRHSSYASDFSPIDEGCTCVCCKPASAGGLGLTRACIYHVASKETAGAHLLSMHNVHYLLNLMRRIREAIIEGRYPEFLKKYFGTLYAGKKDRYPGWAVTALQGVGVDLMED